MSNYPAGTKDHQKAPWNQLTVEHEGLICTECNEEMESTGFDYVGCSETGKDLPAEFFECKFCEHRDNIVL